MGLGGITMTLSVMVNWRSVAAAIMGAAAFLISLCVVLVFSAYACTELYDHMGWQRRPREEIEVIYVEETTHKVFILS